HFPAQHWYRQRRYLGSALWGEEAGERYESLAGTAASAADAALPEAMYFVVVAARDAASLPQSCLGLSLFTDANDAELGRIDHEAREVLRLDGLLRLRDAALADQLRHSRELEAMVAYRDRLLAERASEENPSSGESRGANPGLDAVERDRLTRQIVAQERIISYRESIRWWLVLPWLRLRRLWNRIRAA
ncbi:MAG TPA: hypothetical protein VKT00_05040, partial [Casimicrobiaceae bacterium]|nr:hypothetical protein [Casimicrobiaceae bacterium]